jgi:hypothetical protein
MNPIKAALADNSSLLNNHAEGNLRVAYAEKAGVADSLSPEGIGDIPIPDPPSPNTGYEGEISDEGWVKLPNGLIIQWGKSPIRKNGRVGYDGSYPEWREDDFFQQFFPIPFPNVCFKVILTVETWALEDRRHSDFEAQIWTFGQTYFHYNIQEFSSNVTNPMRIHYVALGR